MRRAFFLALLTLAAACTGGPAAPPSMPRKPPSVTLLVNNLTLISGKPVVIGIGSASRGASIIVKHRDAHIDVYGLGRVPEPLPGQGCPLSVGRAHPKHCVRDIGTGVKETVEAATGTKAIAIVLRSGPAAVDVRIEYDEAHRKISLNLPELAPLPGASACKDNGCNPYIEMMPLRSGTLKATATFASGLGHLEVQQGRVIAKSFSATGVPYKIPADDTGESPLAVTSHLDTPAEYALAFVNRDPSNPVTGLVLEATWP